MQIKVTELSYRCLILLFIIVSSAAWAANQAQFRVKQFHRDSGGVTFTTNAGTMRIEVCGDRVIHVVASPTAEIPSSKVPVVIQPCKAVDFQVASEKNQIKLSTEAITLTVDRQTGAVAFLTNNGKPVLTEPKNGGKAFDVPALFETNAWQVQQTFSSPVDEVLYGLGQHQEGIFNVRGVPVRLHQANTNISVPFMLSTEGYGLLWNNPSLTDFNPADQAINVDTRTGKGKFTTGAKGSYGFLLASDNKDQLVVDVNGKHVIDLVNMWTPSAASGVVDLEANKEYEVSAKGGPGGIQLSARPPQDTTTFRSEVGQAIDYYFFYGPELNRVIADYRQLTGEAPLFPKWVYGYWQCRERYHTQAEILGVGEEFRKRKLPVDALVQDWQYWGKYGWNAMKFDESNYPDPKGMMDRFHALDEHVPISVWSRFGEDSDIYKRMSAKSLLVAGTPWADFFNPQAQTAFWAELKQGIFDYGLDGWWMDASEPEFDILKGHQTFLGGGESVRNAYPLYVTKSIYEGQRSTTDRKRVVIFTRSAYSGQQRYSAISWSGDISSNWITFQRQIPAGLSFSMSGLPYWTTDGGGFFRPKDQYTNEAYHELLIRWFQYAAFCPIFRVHGWISNAEIWNYGPKVLDIATQFDELRYHLLPYIYSAAWGVTNNGDTLMRALPLEFSSDPSARTIADQFMFGPALLINPVTTEGASQRSLYLPAGHDWVDFWTGKRLSGGQTVTAEAPIDRIPIYAKAGSIIPFGPEVQSASAKSDPIDLRIYDGADGDFTLYEDEGDNYNYEHGAYSVIPIHWDDKTSTLTVGDRRGSFPGMLEHRTFRIVRVSEGHGIGIAAPANFDAIVEFEGKVVSLQDKARM